MTTITTEERPEDLLTPLSYALSLAPPRAPPLDSAHRALLAGHDPSTTRHHYVHHNHDLQHNHHQRTKKKNTMTTTTNNTWIYKLLHRAHLSRCRHGTRQHPHLQENRDAFGLWLDKRISVPTWNKLRDDGWFRLIADTMVLLGIPVMAMTSPRATLQFISLSRQMQQIPYGNHAMQHIDFYTNNDAPNSSKDDNNDDDELLVFIHGGAWGSGMPWMYRLVAQGFPDHTNVAVVGYRTYPDASVQGQVQDLTMALAKLQSLYATGGKQFTIVGHSSGAHIALIHVIQEATKCLLTTTTTTTDQSQPPYHTFIGISGPYDIVHHYDYEAARGVEELSPLKAAGGLSLENLHTNSPANQLQDLLLLHQGAKDPSFLQKCMPHRILLVHGMEDTVVPFTATCELSRRLTASGLSPQQLYLAKTGHQETVMQLMLGGLTRDKIVSWLGEKENDVRESAILGLTSRL